MNRISSQQASPDLIEAPDLSNSPRSGRVARDDRGNSIWEWQTAPGIFTREISSQQLEALEATGLQIVDLGHADVRSVSGHLHVGQFSSVSGKRKTGNPSAFEKLLNRLGLPR